MKKTWILIFIVIGFGLLLTKEKKITTTTLIKTQKHQVSQEPSSLSDRGTLSPPQTISKNMEATSPLAIEAGRPRLRDSTPDLEKLRDEVAKDPHSTPLSLLEFSLEIGARMDSVQNEQQAYELFREFEDCIVERPETKPQTVQALCLLNARRLSGRFEGLKNSYVALASRADQKILNLSQALN